MDFSSKIVDFRDEILIGVQYVFSGVIRRGRNFVDELGRILPDGRNAADIFQKPNVGRPAEEFVQLLVNAVEPVPVSVQAVVRQVLMQESQHVQEDVVQMRSVVDARGKGSDPTLALVGQRENVPRSERTEDRLFQLYDGIHVVEKVDRQFEVDGYVGILEELGVDDQIAGDVRVFVVKVHLDFVQDAIPGDEGTVPNLYLVPGRPELVWKEESFAVTFNYNGMLRQANHNATWHKMSSTLITQPFQIQKPGNFSTMGFKLPFESIAPISDPS